MTDVKKIIMLISMVLILFLVMGSIFASEDILDVSSLESHDEAIINGCDFIGCSNDSAVEEYGDGDISDESLLESSNDVALMKSYYDGSSDLKQECKNDVVSSGSDDNISTESDGESVLVAGNPSTASSVKVAKSTTKVYSPTKFILYKKNTYYKIKVVDSKNSPIKNVLLNVTVVAGKKYEFSIKTNSKGVAKLPTKNLPLGTHKILIRTNDVHYKIKKNSKIVIRKSVPKQIPKLKVYAPIKEVVFGSSNYFKILLNDDYDDGVKNVLVKVKVFTGKKFKTFFIKSNSKGAIKLKTNKLTYGAHKIFIKNGDNNYRFSKFSKILVNKKSVFSNKMPKTRLISIKFCPEHNGKYYVKLLFHSKKGVKYQILRKSTGNYKVISTVKANSPKTLFHEKIGRNVLYTYSVRKIVEHKNVVFVGPHDAKGLKLLACPNVKVDFQNLNAKIQWSKVKGATKYLIFRKVGRSGTFKCIATVDESVRHYSDIYYKSANDLPLLYDKACEDPSSNNLFYTVRAYYIKYEGSVAKKSYGLYLIDGDFHLEAPTIVSLKQKTIKWGEVPNAEGYLVIKKQYNGKKWKVIGKATAKNGIVQSLKIGTIDKNAFYSVRAYSHKNGKAIYSDFDKGFSLRNYHGSNSKYKILYFGDSITYGSPYKHSSKHIFSIPYRVAQLLGCVYYNPSVPGSTYHDLGQKNGKNIENSNYYRYRINREVVDRVYDGKPPANWKSLDNAKNSNGDVNTAIKDYNIVVLAAGTNDYKDNSKLGSLNSTDVSTFNGALNHILGKIEDASKKRVESGELPIKVVFVDLVYSEYAFDITKRCDRDTTPNKYGLTLADYQNALDEQLAKWENSSEYLSFYNFNTRNYDIINSKNCPYTTMDNLHPTKFTYSQYGNVFADFLLKNVFD